MTGTSRRAFLTTSALTVGALSGGSLLASCSSTTGTATSGTSSAANTAPPAPATLQATWWGNATRNQLIQKVIDAFTAKHSETKITAQAVAWQGYWDQLATSTAAGTGGDWIMMDMGYLAEYAQRGALADLEPLIGKSLDVSGIPKSLLDSGRIKGKLYVVPLATNTQIILTNQTLLDEIKVTMPDNVSWDAIADMCHTITGATSGKTVGATNSGGAIQTFETWLRGQGVELYAVDKEEIGFTEAHLVAWYDFWQKLQKDKVVLSPDAQAQADANTGANFPLVTRAAAMEFNWSPQWTNYQGLTKEKVMSYPQPVGPKGSGNFLKAANYFSASTKSKNLERAAQFTSFMLNDPQAVELLGSTLGIPASAAAQQAVAPKLQPTDAATLQLHQAVEKFARPQARPWAKGHNKLTSSFQRAYQDVSFARRSPAQAAKDLVQESKTLLG